MIYVFDNDAFRIMSHYYPTTFKTLWENMDLLADTGELISVKDVVREIESKLPNLGFLEPWIKKQKKIFVAPEPNEMLFVAEIFRIAHFRMEMGEQAILRGDPHADPFLIAAAKVRSGTVVTQEKWKPNSGKIPNVCDHFGVPHMTIEKFFQTQSWTF